MKRGGVHARNYVVHIRLTALDRALCGRRNVNFFGSTEEVMRDLDKEAYCRQCRKNHEQNRKSPEEGKS